MGSAGAVEGRLPQGGQEQIGGMRLEIREYPPGRRSPREALRPCDVAAQREGAQADGEHSELDDGLSMELVEPEHDTERICQKS